MVAVKCTFKSMSGWFGQKPAIAVTPDDIKAWLQSHTEWSAKTKLNNLKYASSLFVWCVNNRILTYNPCKGVIRPAVPFRAVKILTVSSIRQLFKTCQENDRAMLGFLSLVTFGGLRVMEARRCLASNLTKGKIDLGGDSCKLNDRRCLDISPQLGAWLAAWQSDGQLYGTVGVPSFSKRLKSLIKLSGVALPKNSLRHSFCSYNLELHGSEATARAANNSPAMLNRHYLATVSKEEAEEFLALMPEIACKGTEPCNSQLTPTQP
jgi:site-specific recombinase XerD